MRIRKEHEQEIWKLKSLNWKAYELLIKLLVLIKHGLSSSWIGSKKFYKEIKYFFKNKFKPKKD